jgi:hypothetical protein
MISGTYKLDKGNRDSKMIRSLKGIHETALKVLDQKNRSRKGFGGVLHRLIGNTSR